ncbi:baseplate J/gp47 family protein [Herbaspirillum huttiense]|uniref:Baseplate J/gp47 family protein n=2 Tax=Herbaspirillum huttiense TaxID=863372 RepID=A0AAJ2HF11_9BURK|nr:baseplate J/gp47 family protein [Herbaspirillum huttiense]MDR9839466.1 baseplate J/gp47 family protein [Herbaspirillum huttiense]
MSTSSVPSIVFSDTGPVAPSESAILAGVQADTNAAFGGDLNPALETPQGQLNSSETAVIGDKNNEILFLANQFDPNYASGRWQDALAAIYFIDRNPALPTVVTATCSGLTGTTIPVGAQAKASDGNIYVCTQADQIPAGGSVDLQFACAVNGPIACPANSLNAIYQGIPGWDSINNAADGTVGAYVESRADFEYRRKQSVAINGVNSVQSIYARVFNVADVLDAYVVDNPLGTDQVVGGVTLLKNSVYVAVTGGAVADIAKAIWGKKSLGCNYNGNTTFAVTDTSGYAIPYPTYQVKFQIPTALPIFFAVQIANNPSLPANIVSLVQQAIIGAFNGTDGGQRARIGGTLFASRYYGPVIAVNQFVSILSLKLGTTASPTLDSYTPNIDRQPTISAANIAVALV